MSKYALTEQEREWLELRKSVCFRCNKRRQTCSLSLREDCQESDFPIRNSALMCPPDYRDAAEFESRCLEKAFSMAPQFNPVPDAGFVYPMRDRFLKYIRIAVEEEMDNE